MQVSVLHCIEDKFGAAAALLWSKGKLLPLPGNAAEALMILLKSAQISVAQILAALDSHRLPGNWDWIW